MGLQNVPAPHLQGGKTPPTSILIYADVYFQSSWEDVALEVTVFSVNSTNLTYKTYSG